MWLLTIVRQIFTSIRWTIGTIYYLPFKFKVLTVMIAAAVYMERYGASRAPYTWYIFYYQMKAFLITVFRVLMPLAYLYCRLVFGLLYPAYASYKAVKTKNVKEYMKWMMYWIVFALFTAVETFADVFLAWLPFYYEIKMVFVFWLLSPVTKGSSMIYRKFVHPQLNKREKEIDEAIAQARTKGYSTLVTLGHKGLTYATNVVVNTAIKGQSTLVEQIKKSYSTNDLRVRDSQDEIDAPYIDDSDDEFAIIPTVTEKEKPKPQAPPTKTESRLIADNKELDRREKLRQDKLNRRPFQRSKSDAGSTQTSTRSSTRRSRPSAGLSKVDEVEHETSMVHDKNHSDNDGMESYEEEIIEIYHSPGRPGHYTTKQVKADPYATLPRTRSRQRPRLNPNI